MLWGKTLYRVVFCFFAKKVNLVRWKTLDSMKMRLRTDVYLDPETYAVISDNNLIFCRVLELESALEDEAYLDQRRIRQICKLRTLPDHLRTQVWKVNKIIISSSLLKVFGLHIRIATNVLCSS